MKNKIIPSLILFGCIFNTYTLYAQSDKVSYQMILESKIGYTKLDKESALNPANFMHIKTNNSLSQLYPIVSFNNTLNHTTTRLKVEGNLKNYNFEQDSTSFEMQEIYGQLSVDYKHYFTFGKKRLDWGTGMIWNPTNFFVQKDPLRTQNRLAGIFMLNYTYILTDGELSFYIFPDTETKDFKLALKYNYSGNRIDASLSFVEYKKYQQLGIDLSYGGDLFTLYSEGVVKNFTNSYRIATNGKLILPKDRNGLFYIEAVVGTSIILNPRLHFTAEYRYRGNQLTSSELAIYKKQLPANLLLYDPISLSKNSCFASLTYSDLYNRWSLNLRTFFDPVSNQLIVSPLGTFTLNNFQIELSAMIYNNAFSLSDFQTQLLISYNF